MLTGLAWRGLIDDVNLRSGAPSKSALACALACYRLRGSSQRFPPIQQQSLPGDPGPGFVVKDRTRGSEKRTLVSRCDPFQKKLKFIF